MNSSVLHQPPMPSDTHVKAAAVIRDLCDTGRLGYPEPGVSEKGGMFTPWTAADGSVFDCFMDILGISV